MPVIARRPSAVSTETGEILLVYSEPAKYSLPAFSVTDRPPSAGGIIPLLLQDEVWAMGTRLTYLMMTRSGKNTDPATPVLVFSKDASNSARPLKTTVLHNAIDPTIQYDLKTKTVHMFWWWNGWTPDYQDPWSPQTATNAPLGPLGPPTPIPSPPPPPGPPPPPPSPLVDPNKTIELPKPPSDIYAFHCPPDELTPAWTQSVVPKRAVEVFDPRRPFWVAPLPDGHQYDYFPENSNKIGESRVGGDHRMPDTPGARLLQSMISRGLIEYPGPPGADFNQITPPLRDDWERRGGIVAAGAHLREAAKKDTPEFINEVKTVAYTGEQEMAFLPGYDKPLPTSCTIEDHLVIVNSMRAFFDNANLVNTNRVLMYSRGRLYEDMSLEVIPKSLVSSNPQTGVATVHPAWPSGSPETVTGKTFLILDHPKVVAHYPVKTNYRTLINPDMVLYPLLDFPEVSAKFFNDGFLADTATVRTQQDPSVDWSLQDPTPGAGRGFDIFRNNLDLKSY